MEIAKSDRDWISGIAGDGVVTIGDPRLKAPCAPIETPSEAGDLLEGMVARLRALNGAGLAAPQTGASVRAIVVEVRKTDVFPDRPTSPLIQMINPVITEVSDELITDWEGCFSVPGLMGLVDRASSIRVAYVSPNGASETEAYSGYVARVLQHEIDHLNGIEFVDRMKDMTSLSTVKNYLAHHLPH